MTSKESNRPDIDSLAMFVLDVLRYDMETIPLILDLLNNDGSIGWRFAWKGEFTEQQVIPVVEELVRRGLIRCLIDQPGSPELIPLEALPDIRRNRQSLWFKLTPEGLAEWDVWDPPIDTSEVNGSSSKPG